VVAQKESTLETTVVESRIFHDLTFPREMPNTVAAESLQISIQVRCELTFRADTFASYDWNHVFGNIFVALNLRVVPLESSALGHHPKIQGYKNVAAERMAIVV